MFGCLHCADVVGERYGHASVGGITHVENGQGTLSESGGLSQTPHATAYHNRHPGYLATCALEDNCISNHLGRKRLISLTALIGRDEHGRIAVLYAVAGRLSRGARKHDRLHRRWDSGG